MDGEASSHIKETIPEPVQRPGRLRRWVGPGLLMGAAWGLVDLTLETVNQSTGAIAPMRPFSFLLGPAAAVVVGAALKLRGRGDWIRALVLALTVAVAVLFGFALVAASGGLGSSQLPGPGVGGSGSVQTVDIGTGGDGCQIERQARTFVVGDEVRASAQMNPAIPTGTTVTITLRRDGSMEPGYPVVQVADSAWDCVYGNVAFEPLRPGHYRWELSTPDLPAIGGDFEVTASRN